VLQTVADKHEKKLLNDLLQNYERRLRPTTNSTQPLNVTFGLSLAQLIDVVCKTLLEYLKLSCMLIKSFSGKIMGHAFCLYKLNLGIIHYPCILCHAVVNFSMCLKINMRVHN